MSRRLLVMPYQTLSDVGDAIESVACGNAKRVDGNGWKVYAAGTIIRVDIRTDALTDLDASD